MTKLDPVEWVLLAMTMLAIWTAVIIAGMPNRTKDESRLVTECQDGLEFTYQVD